MTAEVGRFDLLKTVLVFTVALLVLYFTYKVFNPTKQESGAASLVRDLLPEKTVLHSCSGPGCSSYIEIDGRKLASFERGIAVFALQDGQRVEVVSVIDHCLSHDVFSQSPKIRDVVAAYLGRSALATRAIVFLGSDTINCNFQDGTMKDVERWLEGAGLKKLAGAAARDAYIAVVDPKSWRSYELRDNKTIEFRR